MLEYWWVGAIVFVLFVIFAAFSSGEEEKSKIEYADKTPERRKLIAQLYQDRVDLKEITFILRRAGYNNPKGEEITMKEIMEEHADMQIEKHKGQQMDSAEDVTEQA